MVSTSSRSQLVLFLVMYTLMASSRLVRSFVVPAMTRGGRSRLWASTLPEITTMRAGEIKKELESYGINTKSFLEKSELVTALEKARKDGLKPKASSASTSSSSSSKSSSSSSNTETSSASTSDSRPREERLKEEMENCKAMKASELKKELEQMGVSTKALFEKSEFVQALAEARVDGVQKKKGSSSGGNTGGEGYAEYTDVEVLTDNSSGPRKRSQQGDAKGGAGSNPFGGANPFGGGGIPGGFPGGMGGMADMLKNMGGMGGGASPFGGAANPFAGGDVMGKAQEMINNPRVREIMAKAQGNPRLLNILNECVANPAAISKHENDPEVSELSKLSIVLLLCDFFHSHSHPELFHFSQLRR
eukprot:scaffold429_cov169-Amphora_coffeaeformis.AAC.9